MSEPVVPGTTVGAFIDTPAAARVWPAPSLKSGTTRPTFQPTPAPESSITVNGGISALVSWGVPLSVTSPKSVSVG